VSDHLHYDLMRASTTTSPAATPRRRLSAEVRREQILRAAISEFAIKGLYGTSTESIAQRAGISQPYLFRLYGTKLELYLACVALCFERTREVFRDAAQSVEGQGSEATMAAMGAAYVEMLADRELLLAQLQAYAACADDAVRAVVRRHYEELYDEVAALSGAPAEDVRSFFAHGMLLNTSPSIDLPELGDPEKWSRRICSP
jgi:AcrR family transcriptional regulator